MSTEEPFREVARMQVQIHNLSTYIHKSVSSTKKQYIKDEIPPMEYNFDQVIESLIILRDRTKALMESYTNN